jgi:hypothetical protein
MIAMIVPLLILLLGFGLFVPWGWRARPIWRRWRRPYPRRRFRPRRFRRW